MHARASRSSWTTVSGSPAGGSAGHDRLKLLVGPLPLHAGQDRHGCRNRRVAAGTGRLARDPERLGGVGLGSLRAARAVPESTRAPPGRRRRPSGSHSRGRRRPARRGSSRGLVEALQQSQDERGHRPARRSPASRTRSSHAPRRRAPGGPGRLREAASDSSTTARNAPVISAKRSKSVCGVPRGSFRWEKMSPRRRRTVALSNPAAIRVEQGLRRLVLLVHVAERGLEHVGRLARAPRDQVQHAIQCCARRRVGPPASAARSRCSAASS